MVGSGFVFFMACKKRCLSYLKVIKLNEGEITQNRNSMENVPSSLPYMGQDSVRMNLQQDAHENLQREIELI